MMLLCKKKKKKVEVVERQKSEGETLGFGCSWDRVESVFKTVGLGLETETDLEYYNTSELCYFSQLDPKTLSRLCRSQLAPLSLSLLLIQSLCWAQLGVNHSHTSLLTAHHSWTGHREHREKSSLCGPLQPLIQKQEQERRVTGPLGLCTSPHPPP